MTVTKAVEILAAHKDGYDDYEEDTQIEGQMSLFGEVE